MVVTAVFQLGVSHFDSPVWSAFNSRFTKFVLGNIEGVKFVKLVWKSNVGEAGSNNVNFCYLGEL